MFAMSAFHGRGVRVVGGGGGGGEGANIPLSWDDARFSSNTAETTYVGFGAPVTTTTTFDNKDWDGRPSLTDGDECVRFSGSTVRTLTANQCRSFWREGFRGSGTNGTINYNECFMSVIGDDPLDHPDGMQNFGGTNFAVNATDTCFRPYSDTEAKALRGSQATGSDGFRWADFAEGAVTFSNVLFLGGGRALTIVADSGTTTIDFENVYFVELSDGYTPSAHYFYRLGANGGTFTVNNWTNVCKATIVDGVIIPGEAIASPGNRSGAGDFIEA